MKSRMDARVMMMLLMLPTLGNGELVVHSRYGIGRVIQRWEAFSACPDCFASCPAEGATPCCNATPITVFCHGIYDVEFGDGLHSVNKLWLRPFETFAERSDRGGEHPGEVYSLTGAPAGTLDRQ
jgi:hypothetical protein